MTQWTWYIWRPDSRNEDRFGLDVATYRIAPLCFTLRDNGDPFAKEAFLAILMFARLAHEYPPFVFKFVDFSIPADEAILLMAEITHAHIHNYGSFLPIFLYVLHPAMRFAAHFGYFVSCVVNAWAQLRPPRRVNRALF